MNWSELDRDLDADTLPEACFVFGLHKSGSTLMHDMVAGVCKQAKISCLDIPGRAFADGLKPKDWISDKTLLPTFQHKRLFYGFRFLPKILLHPDVNLRERKSVLLVRDPRDALVSEFFSFGGKHLSHVLPKKNTDAFLAPIQDNASLNIDEYVLHRADGFLQRVLDYRNHLDFRKTLLRRYEDVYFEKRKFLGDIFDHFSIDVSPAILDGVSARHDIRPEVEDVSKHIRKGTPGDYACKLKPETIEDLNRTFKGTFESFGYDLKLLGV